LYLDLVGISLSDIARSAFEDLMASNYEFQSDFAKKHRNAGRTEGRAEGRAEGQALGEASALVTFLQSRGIAVSDAQRAKVLACTDLEVLERWIRKAVTVTSVDELFED
ncbi:MAG TPA: hypothetical protein VM925_21545, partial [Labilithrix sp.]|nr:hypothetical protein [Labilithrix sp.]